MSSSTFRAEIVVDGRPVGRRAPLALGALLAGTHPLNPIQAGIGMTVTVSVGGAAASVFGRLIYMLDGTELSSQRLSFTQVSGSSSAWSLEGAAGGPNLGFPAGIDYDEPKPFEIEITVLYRGGEDTKRYGFWVGSSRHQLGETCRTREGFYALFKNCCLNGVGFRSNTPLMPYGDFDSYFDPDDYPWATGLSLGGESITRICAPERELLNPYIPDSISGDSGDHVDNPFVTPSRPLILPRTPYVMLSGAERLVEQFDGSAAECEIVATSATIPNDDTDTAFTVPPGYDRLSPAWLPAPVRPSASRTNRLRAFIGAQWVNGTSPVEASASLTPTATLRIALSGFDPGERVYLFVSTVRPQFIGPGITVLSAPLGVNSTWPTAAIDEPRLLAGSGGPASGIGSLLMGLGIVTGGAASPFLAPRAITGGATWAIGALGGVANLGSQTGLTVVLPADWTYLAGALALYGAQAMLPDSVMPLYVQGVVVRPTNAPTPTTAGGGTGLGNFGVDWPHSSFLTNVAMVRVAA